LEIGDDVVFGSRSSIIIRDEVEAKPVRIESGAMVADRCILLPGTTVGRGCLIGSATAAQGTLPPGSSWLGSDKGQPKPLAAMSRPISADTLRPFGRAFAGEANYFLLPPICFAFNTLFWKWVDSACTIVPAWVTIFMMIKILSNELPFSQRFEFPACNTIFHLTAYLLLITMVLTLVVNGAAVLLSCFMERFVFVGPRTIGSHDWDKSSYCQDWLLSRAQLKICRHFMDMLRGSPMMSSYYRARGARIGDGVCLYPTKGDPYMPEPDLISVGDYASVDDAYLVAHINTFGSFNLQRVEVREGAVLRSGARIVCGAKVGANTTVMERSLVLPGDEVPRDTVWHGWPGQVLHGDAS
jgi:acetyltransferase-like isoleucine patch superfamily enzyme